MYLGAKEIWKTLINFEYSIIYCVGTKNHVVSKKECREYITNSYTNFDNFDDYINYISTIKIIKINESDWKNSTCTCSHWQKNFICKHIIAVSVNIDLCEFPAVDLKIEGNRRRGRPGKAAKALEKEKRIILPEIDLNSNQARSKELPNEEPVNKKSKSKTIENKENVDQQKPTTSRMATRSSKK